MKKHLYITKVMVWGMAAAVGLGVCSCKKESPPEETKDTQGETDKKPPAKPPETTTPKATKANEAGKVLAVLEAWRIGQQEKAWEVLVGIDWQQPMTFPPDRHAFVMTEEGLVALAQAEQKRIFTGMTNDFKVIREMAKAVADQAQAAQDKGQAERRLYGAYRLGRVLNRDPDGVIIGTLVGIAVQRLTLDELIGIYQETNQSEKLKQAQATVKKLEDQLEAVKKRARGN